MDFEIDMIDSLHDPGVIINMDHILNEIEKAFKKKEVLFDYYKNNH